MRDILNLKNYRSILCLHGDLPDSLFFETMQLPIIAADGSANRLIELGITPQLILGDLDSVHPPLLQKHAHLHIPHQEQSDYQKAMLYLKNKALLPAVIVGINGGHLDHILNNLNIFMDSNCLFYAPPLKGFALNTEIELNLSLPLNTKISIMGIPKATLCSQGLKWELNHSELSFPGQTSCFNRTVLPEITLKVHQGTALVFIYEQIMDDAGLL